MRIESIRIRGFGCLADRRFDFPEGKAVLIVEDNESGKSTLAAAILAGLCGFPARRASGELAKLKDIYQPWDVEGYAIEMDIEAGGRRLRVERDFGRNTCAVRDPETNRDVSGQYEDDLALEFLRLGRDDFQRLAFISGKETQRFSSLTNIQARLSALVEGSTDDSGAEVAIAALGSAVYALDGKSIKPPTAIKRVRDDIDGRTRRMAELEAALDAAGEEAEALDEEQALHEQLAGRLDELDEEFRAARLREVGEQIRAAEDGAREVQVLRQELEELSAYAGFPSERRSQIERAVVRLKERERQAAEVSQSLGGLNRRADELRAKADESKRFAMAADEDLISLGSAEDAVRTAEDMTDRTTAGGRRSSSLRAMGFAMTGIGVTCALVSLGLMVAGTVGVVGSLIGAVTGIALAAAGMVQVSRAGAGARAQAEQAEQVLSEARTRAARLLSRFEVTCGSDALVETLARTRDTISRHIADRTALRTIEAEISARTREAADIRTSLDDEGKTIASVLVEAGIDTSLPLDEALRRFDEAASRHNRYRAIKDSLLPALERRNTSDEAVARLKAEEAELRLQVTGDRLQERGGARAQSAPSPLAGEGWGEGDGDGPPRASSEVEAERQATRARMDGAMERVRALERSVGARVDTYRRDYPVLQSEVESLTSELAKVTRFDRALGLAIDTMREVAESTHRRWAAALNDRASAILPHLNPDYDELRFDESLSFTLRHVSDSRIVEKADIDTQLSTGAKDQVYLAVRLACCEELSQSGESIPLILDDPLIAADDERFARGFAYLAQSVARDHQVIILSCHKARHERLAGEQWFRDGVCVLSI